MIKLGLVFFKKKEGKMEKKKEEKMEMKLVSEGHHLVLNNLKGKKDFKKLKEEVFYVDPELCSYQVKGGVFTRKRTVRVLDLTVGPDNMSLLEVVAALPGSWERKWFSQSQVSKFCKHFKSWLKDDDYGNVFICKIDEFREFDEENPTSNLMLVAVYKDSDNDLRVYKTSEIVYKAKRELGFPFRIILPAR